MRLVDKESEWYDTQAEQKQNKNKQRIVKAWTVSLIIILCKISQTDITHTQLSYIPPTTTCRHFVQVVDQRWLCCTKNRSQHWENLRQDRLRFHHMPCSPVNYFMLLWFRFVQKGLFKILFKGKSEKSDDKVHQSGLSKRRPLSVRLASLYSAVLWPMCFAWTADSHSL